MAQELGIGNEPRPFEGLKVIDCATYVAGPSASMILSDLGADVIKIEPPEGDPFRFILPDGQTWLFDLEGRGRRGIALDLRQPEAREILYKLCAQADVFVTNTPLKARKKLGISAEEICGRFPRVVYASITGYGERGPDRDVPGFDATSYWARSGLQDVVKPGADAPPATSVAAMGDHPTSTALFAAIATGLYRRERTGKGGVVGTSLLANGMWSNSSLLQASLDKVDLPPVKPRTEASPLFNNYRCKCGKWLNLSILNFEKLFPPAARILGIPELIGDPRFLTPEGRRDNAAVMVAILDKAFATQDREYWAQEFEKAGITWAKISTLQDVISDPQAHAAGHIVPFVDGSGMTINTPIELGGVEKKRPTRAPELGQHTWEVLHELGYSEKEIERMAKDGIIVESAGVRSKL